MLRYFSVVNTILLHGLPLVGSVDIEEGQIQRGLAINYIWITSHVVQGSSVCLCVCVYMYMYVCTCICVYTCPFNSE